MSGYSEKTTVYEPGRRLHQTTNLLVPWLGLSSLQISEWWISVVYKPLSLWYFIITVWMDYDTIIFLFKIKKIFFLKWTIFKVLIEFVTSLLLFYVFVFWMQIMWDPSSLIRDQTCIPALEGKVFINNWTSREVPLLTFFKCTFWFSRARMGLEIQHF